MSDLVPVNTFTKEHLSIKDRLVERLLNILKREDLKLITYVVDSEYVNRETIRLDTPEGIKIELTIRTPDSMIEKEIPF